MKEWFLNLPKFIVGPLAVIAGILYFVVQDPPKTVCDTQFEIFKKEAGKNFYPSTKKGITLPASIKGEIEACQRGNSSGSCYAWMESLKKLIHATRNIPGECGERFSELDPVSSWYTLSIYLFSQISWNDTPMVRAGLYNWLEPDDVVVYCRLKSEFIRLRGEPAWTALESGFLKELMKLKKMTREQAWERTVLSHRCKFY